MNLKRTVYHIAGKDYESHDIIEFTFYIQRVSVNNFLNLNYNPTGPGLIIRNICKKFGSFQIDQQRTNVDAAIMPITLKCHVCSLYKIFETLGMHSGSSIENMYLYVRKRELRAKQIVVHKRYDGISVFDPVTKKQHYTSGSPVKIEGRQAVINGKLWRKYRTNPL